MCNAMNPGWAFTFLGLVYVALIAVVLLVMKDGMRWRQNLEERKRSREAEKRGRTKLELLRSGHTN
jgi:hypothetical protein